MGFSCFPAPHIRLDQTKPRPSLMSIFLAGPDFQIAIAFNVKTLEKSDKGCYAMRHSIQPSEMLRRQSMPCEAIPKHVELLAHHGLDA